MEERDDGYLHVPVSVTTYVNKDSNGNPSINADSYVMIYVVSTATERVGTDSDVAIIQRLLARNYVVCVADYHNNTQAVA